MIHDDQGFSASLQSLGLGSNPFRLKLNYDAAHEKHNVLKRDALRNQEKNASSAGKEQSEKGKRKKRSSNMKMPQILLPPLSFYGYVADFLVSKVVLAKLVACNIEGASASSVATSLVSYMADVTQSMSMEPASTFFANLFKQRLEALSYVVNLIASGATGVSGLRLWADALLTGRVPSSMRYS